jgi:hydrogenase-4 component E
VLLWRRRSNAHIAAFSAQSVALAATIALVGHFTGDGQLYAVAAILFLLKGVAIPVLLRRMERQFGAQRELEPYVNTATSLLLGGLLVLLAYVITRPLATLSQLPTRAGMPLAMGLIFVSLFVIISRKKALTQVIGFLVLENGIALLAVLGTYGIPLILELGVFLDALMGFLVMQIFVYQIHETFESIDVDQLKGLRK